MILLLVPTDFSAVSQQALQYGLAYLQEREEKGKILLLNTYLLPNASPDRLVAIHDELRKKAIQKLEAQVGLAQKTIAAGNVSFEILSHMGSLENVVAHLIQKQKVDLVVLGLNGKAQEKEQLSKILDRIHCPLIIVPDQENS